MLCTPSTLAAVFAAHATVALIGLHDVRNLTAKVDHRDQREMIWRSTMNAGSPALIVRRGVN
jgi:hypothetical protein